MNAKRVRMGIMEALGSCGGGHYGGSMSCVEIGIGIFEILRNSAAGSAATRDRFVLSKGHAAPMWYSLLRQAGLLGDAAIADFAKFGGGLEGHPDMTTNPWIDFSTGSLGQGVSIGLGMALCLKQHGLHVWVLVGDGECQEGQIWEAALAAARHNCSNLHVVVDLNMAQECTGGLEWEPLPDALEKWKSFGWAPSYVDGHDLDALRLHFEHLRRGRDGPTVTIARTVKGKGLPFAEREPLLYHCAKLTPGEEREGVASLC